VGKRTIIQLANFDVASLVFSVCSSAFWVAH